MTTKAIGAKEAYQLATAVRDLVKRPDWRAAPPLATAGRPTSRAELPLTNGLRTASVRLLELLLRTVDEAHIAEHSTSYLSRALLLSERTVRRARHELCTAGLIEIDRPGGPATGTTRGYVHTRYRVLVDRLRQLVQGVLKPRRRSSTSGPGDPRPLVPGTPGLWSPGPQASGPRDPRTTRAGARSEEGDQGESPLSPQAHHAGDRPVDRGVPPVTPPVPDCQNCRTGRSCRLHGTDQRTRARVERQKASREAADRRKAQQAQARRAAEEARGDVVTVGAGIAALRAAIGAERARA